MNKTTNPFRWLKLTATLLATVLWLSTAVIGISSGDALKLLKEGNARFTTGTATHHNAHADRVAATSEGQAPFTVILTCSDSRVSPEIIFDRSIGDLFVVRDAGNVVDQLVVGSIEYGVGHLKAPLVVVMGHTRCGAVEAAVSGGHAEGSIPEILHKIQPAVKTARNARPALTGQQLTDAAARANVRHSINELLNRSPELREAAKKGSVRLVGAMYDVASGRIQWLSEGFTLKLPAKALPLGSNRKQAFP